VTPDVRRFDVEHGDANVITRHVEEQFDFVFSSHCLEHMHDPRKALLSWWELVRPSGVLFFLVPDEDLYAQGVFPSRFNPDHKATFTISKRASWSPVSANVLDLCRSLPDGEIVSSELHDIGYDRSRLVFGTQASPQGPRRSLHCRVLRRGGRMFNLTGRAGVRVPVDQTMSGALAQI